MTTPTDAALAFASSIATAELDLVGMILADHVRAVPVANEEGIDAGDFDQPDLRIIYLAAAIGAEHSLSLIDVLRLSRAGLRDACLWDAGEIVANVGAMRWSDETLAALAGSWFYAAPLVRNAARHLSSLTNRRREAERCYAGFVAALTGRKSREGISADGLPAIAITEGDSAVATVLAADLDRERNHEEMRGVA